MKKFILVLIELIISGSLNTYNTPNYLENPPLEENSEVVEALAQSDIKNDYIEISESGIILDVRTESEYDAKHIKDAISLPIYELKIKAEEFIPNKEQEIFVYCESGEQSLIAYKELLNMGYENVYDIGGIDEWTGELLGEIMSEPFYNYFGEPLPPNKITPIDFETTRKIHEELSEFTFHIIGSSEESYGTNHDKSFYYVSNRNNDIKKILIKNAEGDFAQEISNLHTMNFADEEIMYGFAFDDWNFDGYTDISLWISPGGTMLNSPHYFWLWDNGQKQFVENAELMEISDSASVSINNEENIIEAYTRYGMASGITCKFEYIDDHFTMVYSCEYKYESPNNDDEYLRRVIIQKLVNGEMVTEDYYEQ